MPTRDHAPIGAPCWIELVTSDPDRSRAFYHELFGWAPEEPNEQFGGYFNYKKDGIRVAGCMTARDGMPVQWFVYLASDDAQKTADAAATNGGQVLVPPMAVADLGTMVVLADPEGAGIGVWQPGTHPGFGVYDEPGTPAWFELHTRTYDRAVPFYREVFRWDTQVMSDTPEFRFTTVNADGLQLAGVMDGTSYIPEGTPGGWLVYFRVPDTDVALTDAVRLGGTALEEPVDTPYGRLADVRDPTGARFKVVGPNVG